jgi:hypothetical protein
MHALTFLVLTIDGAIDHKFVNFGCSPSRYSGQSKEEKSITVRQPNCSKSKKRSGSHKR